jgi:hypothetical protein
MIVYSILITRKMKKTRNETGEGFAAPGYWRAQAKWLKEKFSRLAGAELNFRILPKTSVPGKI